jgi:hypothetical protein
MAKNKIILGKLDIDAKDLVKSSMDIKKQIDELVEKQGKLTEKGKESSAQFITNEAAIKSLEAAYKSQIAALSAYANEEGKIISQKKAVKEAVKEVNNSENDYIKNNKELLELKKQLNSNSDDYEKRLAKINAKIMENNAWLQENGSEHAKLITTMDDYKQQIADSFDSINIFNGGITGFISRAQEAGGVGPLLSGAFKGITGGIKGMGEAITKNPVGAILAILVPIIQALFNAFKSFTPIVEKVEQVMAGVDAVFQSVKNSIIGLLTGATSIGDFFSNFASSAAEAAEEAMKLEEAQQKLNKQLQLQEIENEKAKNSIDALRAASEDDTKSIKERGKSLEDAMAAERKNMDGRKKLAEDAYNIAQAQIASGTNLTKEEKKNLKEKGLAYAQELLKRKEISEEEIKALEKAELDRARIYGESAALSRKHITDQANFKKQADAEEQATQRDAEDKAKELADKQKERQDKALERQKQQFELWAAEADAHGKSLEERLKYEDDYASKSIAILQNELKLKKISLEEFKTAKIGIENTQAENKLQIAQDNAKATLELWKEENRSKMKAGEDLTAAMVAEEKTRLEYIKDENMELLAAKMKLDATQVENKRKNNVELTQKEAEFLTEMLRLQNEFNSQISANDEALEEADKARKQEERDNAAAKRAELYEEKLAAELTEYEEAKLLEQQRYDEELATLEIRRVDELLSDEEYARQKTAIEASNKENVKKIEQDLVNFKLAQQNKLMGDMATILGKESKAGKAFSIAQATIDTYQSAVAAYKSQLTMDPSSPVRGAIAAAAAVAMGLRNIQKIAGVKEPKFEKGGLMGVGGNLHSAGGTKFVGSDGTRFEAERGELIGVLNRNAARHFMAFNNTFPSGGTATPNYFASGGIVSREIAQQGMNMDELALKIAEANRSLPPPVVAVEDIITRGNNYIKVKEGANF